MTARVLVTGADGFVGRAVCPVLSDEGFAVRAAVRRADDVTARLPCEEVVAVGDIGSVTVPAEAFAGVDAVVHLAGRAHVLKETAEDPRAEFRRVNAFGTEHLARMAASAGARRFVYTSSIGVNGRTTHGRAFDEEDPPSPHNAYAASKWEAERALRRVAAETGLEVVVLRPPLMYGPHVKANFLRLMKLVDRGLPLPLGSVHNRRSLLYVYNLAGAIAACIDRPEAAGETFLISDGEDVSTPELVRRIARALGRKSRLLPFPPRLMRAAARLAGKQAMVEQLLDPLVIDGGRIQHHLGWRPPYTMAEGLEETARWFDGRPRNG